MNKPMQNIGELFPPEEVKQESPRNVWARGHDLHMKFSAGLPEAWACWAGEFTLRKWEESGESGATIEEAMVNWARLNKVRLWNEEAIASEPSAKAEDWTAPRVWPRGEEQT